MTKRRQTRKKPVTVVRIGELATKERRRQQGGMVTEVIDREASGKAYIKRQRARLECMLDYYHKQNRISDPQYTAGIKFREIYLSAIYGYSFKVLCNPYLMEAKHADPEGRMLAHIDCTRLLREACDRLTPEQRSLVRDVCGYDRFAGGRDKKRILLRALDSLATFWGYR